jgi:hypothetical protein
MRLFASAAKVFSEQTLPPMHAKLLEDRAAVLREFGTHRESDRLLRRAVEDLERARSIYSNLGYQFRYGVSQLELGATNHRISKLGQHSTAGDSARRQINAAREILVAERADRYVAIADSMLRELRVR